MRVIFFAAAAVGARALSLANPRPVAKVITILKNMRDQLEQEHRDDENVFDKVVCWCETNDKQKGQAVEDAGRKIEQLQSQIEELTGTLARLDAETENLDKEIKAKTGSLNEITNIRGKENRAFIDSQKEMIVSLRALKAAVAILSKHHTQQALVNVAKMVSSKVLSKQSTRFAATPIQRRALSSVMLQGALRQDPQKSFAGQGPIGDGSYTSQSGEIFGILKQMTETFRKNLLEDRDSEADKQLAFIDLKKSLDAEISAATKSFNAKTQENAKGVQSRQIARDDKLATEDTLDADQKFLITLKQTCSSTDEEWNQRQTARAEELKAISSAIAILAADDSHDSFARTYSAPSFLQVRAHLTNPREAAAAKIEKVAQNNPKLQALAVSVKINAFVKVKAAIDGMIADLGVQQKDEVHQHDFCIKAIGDNDLADVDKTKEEQKVQGDIDFAVGAISDLVDDIKIKKDEIELTLVSTKKAGEDREAENQDFQKIIKDQTESLEVLKRAVVVLAKVYQGDEATVVLGLVQTRQNPAQPEGFQTYAKKEGGGVIGLLNTIITDTQNMRQIAITSEQTAQTNYEKFILSSNGSKDALDKAVVAMVDQKAKLEKTLEGDNSTMGAIVAELKSLKSENKDLHQQCDFLIQNFTLRQDNRLKEIDALKSAKAILSGANLGP